MSSFRKYPQFLLLGDSIVQYASLTKDGFSFVAGLSEHCQRRLDIVNRGLSGYNTQHKVLILDEILPPTSYAKADYILLLLGANDACLPSSPSKQHVSLDNYRQNLRTILTHPTLKSHNAKILLVTPPPIHEVHLEAEDLAKGAPRLTREQKVTSQYAQVVREVAADLVEQNVVLVDLNKALMEDAVRRTPGSFVGDKNLLGTLSAGDSPAFRELLVDGLHLTGAGYKVFLDIVLPHVGKEWAEEPFNNPRSWIYPHWTIAPKMNQ